MHESRPGTRAASYRSLAPQLEGIGKDCIVPRCARFGSGFRRHAKIRRVLIPLQVRIALVRIPKARETGSRANSRIPAAGSHCSAATNTCVPPEPLGAACWSDSDCISGHCPLGADTGFAANCIANPLSDDLCTAISE
jgi:hypothetical protein